MAIMLGGAQLTATEGEDAATSATVFATSSGSANTKGTYAELVASTAHRANGFWLIVRSGGNSGDFLLDVAIGSGGSEQVIVANVLFTRQARRWAYPPLYVPLAIPAGTRIAFRVQCTTASSTLGAEVVLVAGGTMNAGGAQLATTYGANTGDSGGVSIDPGGTINTKGAYSEITSATTAPIHWLILAIGNQNNAVASTASWLIDIAIGAAAAEQVVIGNLEVVCDSNEDMPLPALFAVPVSIPAGTRLAVRSQCDISDATDRRLDAVLIGVG